MVASPVSTNTSLKAVCPRKELFEAVQTVGHAVSGRSSLPILSHVLIQSEGNGLRLIATDVELAISCRISNATIEEHGGLTAPSKPLTEVLANLTDRGQVHLSVDKSHTVHVQSEKSKFKILGMPAEEYPRLPDVTNSVTFTIPQAKLREMIRQTLFAVSTDETRAILTGILMVFDGETLKFVATDTHRLALKSAVVTEGQGAQNAIVPARTMNELTRLLTDDEGPVVVTLSPNQVCFALPGDADVRIISRLVEGQFPNYQRVIPSSYQRRIRVSGGDLHRAVRRAEIVARENANRVILETDGEKLMLSAESQVVGSASEEVDVTCEGDDVQIAFNARYLLDVLAVLDGVDLHLELTESLKPGVVRPVPQPPKGGEDAAIAPDYLCVLMPMQIV